MKFSTIFCYIMSMLYSAALSFISAISKIDKFLRVKIMGRKVGYHTPYCLKNLGYEVIKRRIRHSRKAIKVAFFVVFDSVWQYEDLYIKMKEDGCFDPVIVITPYTLYDIDTMNKHLEECNRTFLHNEKYNVIKGYNEETKKFIDIKKTFNPDIVFFSNPHYLVNRIHYIKYFLFKSLTCYVPYGIMVSNLQESQYNLPFHNIIWRNFYESRMHLDMAKKYSDNNGSNVVISGYPKCDIFSDKSYQPNNVWKNKDMSLKKIIWAPHHTIEDDEQELAYSCFLQLSDFMKELVLQFKDSIQIAFKPHPLLRDKLSQHSDWGPEKTSDYYNFWNEIENGQLEEGGYLDLFLTSDAMIFDSMSFMSEYLYTSKPSLFTVKDDTIQKKFNEYGQKLFSLQNKSHSTNDILIFVAKLINGDKMGNEKLNSFCEEFLKTNENSSEFIFYNIKNSVLHGK